MQWGWILTMAICKKCGVMLIGAEDYGEYCEVCQFKKILEKNKISPNSKLAKEIKKQVMVWRK